MSGTSLSYPQQPYSRRASSPDTSANAYQNNLVHVSSQLSTNINHQKGCEPGPFKTSGLWYPTSIRDVTFVWKYQFDCRLVNASNRPCPTT
ncbi:Uncharacterized protein HZ326_19927 [Fusarium oxysporum f. sp. albedinis]|nr:Uncharacterized protein HZ326_19927 [Fusarium oxysporum f. sp. albedinis]